MHAACSLLLHVPSIQITIHTFAFTSSFWVCTPGMPPLKSSQTYILINLLPTLIYSYPQYVLLII